MAFRSSMKLSEGERPLADASSSDQKHGDLGGFEQRAMIRPPLSRDVIRRPMSDAGADDRQTQRDVDSRQTGQQLERDVPLVMIHRDDAVELPTLRLHEQRITRQRTGNVNPGLF